MTLDPIRFLRDTVAIPSVSGRESEAARFLADRCRPYAERSTIDDCGNVRVEVGAGPLHLMVLGHIDTVPGEVPVRIDGNRLYGRGSVDAKGPLCCALLAAVGLSPRLRRAATVTVIGAVEEEVASSRGARFLLGHAPQPDLLLIAEPSGWNAVTLGYKGRLLLQLERRKPNRHSAAEEATAAAEVAAVWARIAEWAESENHTAEGIFDRVQVSLDAISGSGDGLEQRATARIGLRLPPRLPPEEAEAALRSLELGPTLQLEFSGGERAYRGPRDTPLTRAFRSAIRSCGGRPVTKLKTGTSDMNVVAPHWPVPMLAYGPGDSRLDHTPHEHIELDEFLRGISVLSAALTHLIERSYSPDSS